MKFLSAYLPAVLSAVIVLLSAACRQEGPTARPETADIPMYTQLLLKGNVRSVRDSIVVQDHPELTEIIDMTFDEDSNLISYSVNGKRQFFRISGFLAGYIQHVRLRYKHIQR